MPSTYESDSIQILNDIQHIKLRRQMYAGECINPYQLFSEVLDNAVDELGEGYSNKVVIKIDTTKNEYVVRDYGRGIPHGHKILDTGEELEIVEALLTKSNSGGKFNHNSYKHSAGIHGIGVTLTNALSSDMVVKSIRDNKAVEIHMINSEKDYLNYYDTNELSGTYVSFIPDPQYFEVGIIPVKSIIDRCKVLKAFGLDVELYIDNDLNDDVNNITDIFDLLPTQDKIYANTKLKFTSSIDEDIVVALQYTSQTKYSCIGYTNYLYNSFGGTHTRLIYKAICDAWAEFYNEVNTPLKWDDCTLGLDVLVAVFIGDISFSSQTKEKLTVPNKNLEELMEGFKQKFIQYLKDNPELRKGLLKRFEEYRISQNKLLNQKEIMNLVQVNSDTTGKSIRRRSLVPGLVECTSTSRDGTEIYLTEGASAAGPVARARDRKTQAVLPLRGKIKNVTYMSIKDALKSETARNIVNAIGAGVGPDADPNSSRYEKIMMLTDADSDGAHISALILSLLVNITPTLVKAGRVFIVEAPLYGYDYNGKRYYTNDYDSIPDGYSNFTRYKGLGEMDDSELKESCLNPENRIMYQVQYPDDLDKFNYIMGTSDGKSQLLHDLHVIEYISNNEGGTD